MKSSFIGCPCSGKTTTGAMVFAHLKENGIACEFITEQARMYIAKKRTLNPGYTLSDMDQAEIMQLQYDCIDTMEKSTAEANSIVLCDSSPLNSLLYMSPEFRRNNTLVKELVAKISKDPGVVFVCAPVKRPMSLDPNRIHGEAESIAVDESIPFVLEESIPGLLSDVIHLSGAPQERSLVAIDRVLRAHVMFST